MVTDVRLRRANQSATSRFDTIVRAEAIGRPRRNAFDEVIAAGLKTPTRFDERFDRSLRERDHDDDLTYLNIDQLSASLREGTRLRELHYSMKWPQLVSARAAARPAGTAETLSPSEEDAAAIVMNRGYRLIWLILSLCVMLSTAVATLSLGADVGMPKPAAVFALAASVGLLLTTFFAGAPRRPKR